MLDLKAIGGRIKELRGDLSQGEFAEKLGYGQPFVSEIERGVKGPSLEFLLAMRLDFGVSIDFMVTGEKLPAFPAYDPLAIAIRDFARKVKEIQKTNKIPKAVAVIAEGAENQTVMGRGLQKVG